MIHKIITIAIRLGLTYIFAMISMGGIHAIWGEGATIQFDSPAFLAGLFIGFVGLIYSLTKFHKHYTFGVVSKTENQIGEVIDKKKKLQIEEEMLRIKNLFDQDILTEEEYEQKINNLKDKYL